MDYSTIEIVFDHSDFLLINKPAGVSVHKDQQEEGLLAGLSKFLDLKHLYLVHRLDQMTSGLLLLAKTEASNRSLSQMFQRKEMEKYYIAISDKKPKKKQGLIKGDMMKGRGGSWKLMQSNDNPAITQFFSFSLSEVLCSGGDQVSKGLRLYVLKPHTGKTHQLRVALKSVGAAIWGDTRYGTRLNEIESEADRGYLHAWRLCFEYQGASFDFMTLPNSGRVFTHPAFKTFLLSLGHPRELEWPKV